MGTNISSKHYEVDEALRAYTGEQMDRVAQEFENPRLNSVKVTFTGERNWVIASVNVTGKNININAKAKTDTNAQAAVNAAIDRIIIQLRRYLDKVQDASVKGDPKSAEKVWTSEDLSQTANEFDDVSEA